MPERFEDDYEDDEGDEADDDYVFDDDDPGFETDEEDEAPSRWGRTVKIVAFLLVAGMILGNIAGCWGKLVQHFGG